ncbi:hypothetical protein SCOCK_580006 [Actinacidiphila cocklensis]|uniref:Uncharacterized protein n=1 Tax=Actinacidiphila cocklensis TaxID=887465 RepID=A0A9W4DWR6_9ACTN|nr:hypothetical protein SCOCK_580006 [Actinacidiphila cocklensis]
MDHGSSHEPEYRRARTVLTNAQNDRYHADKDAKGRGHSAHAVCHMEFCHMDIINDNLGQQK